MARTSTSFYRGGLANGRTSKSVAGNSNVTLTADEARNRIISFIGALTGNIVVTIPISAADDDALVWTMRNDTTGDFKLRVADSASALPLDLPQGQAFQVEFNGTQFALLDSAQKPGRVIRCYAYESFQQEPSTSKLLGGAASGTTGDRNLAAFPRNNFEWHVKGTQTILTPVMTAVGWDIGQDQTASDGIEITQGILSRCPYAFTVGTDPAFRIRVKIKVEDASGANPLIIGFRKAEAYQAVHTNYADYAAIGIVGTANPNTIQLLTETGGGGTTTTNTTQTWADGATKVLSVLVSAAGVVTYQLDGAAPTVVAAYTFTNALVVVPFLYFLHAADVAGVVEVIEWEVGHQTDFS